MLRNLLLLISLISFGYTTQIIEKPLSKQEFEQKFKNLIPIEKDFAQKRIKTEPDTQKAQESLLVHSQLDFKLSKEGLELTGALKIHFKDQSFPLLPKGWILRRVEGAFPLSDSSGNIHLEGKSNQFVKYVALYPIKHSSSYWKQDIPVFPQSIGTASFDHEKELYSSVQWTLKNPGPLVQFNSAKDIAQAFATISTLNLSAQLKVQTTIKKPRVTQDQPKVKKSKKSMVFVESQHKFEMKARQANYELVSKVKVSRNPIRELSFKLPKNFTLRKLETSPRRSFQLLGEKILFSREVHEKIEIHATGEYALKEGKEGLFTMETRPLLFQNVEEERGFLMFYTNEVVEIKEVQFKMPDLVNRLDATELPEKMIQGMEAPILWAFRYYEPKIDFQLVSKTFASYNLLKQVVRKFHGETEFNSDFSSFHRWSFSIQNEEEGPFLLPIPSESKIRSCELNGKDVHAFKNEKGEFFVNLPKSGTFSKLRQRRIQFSKNNIQLAERRSHNLKVNFQAFPTKEKKARIKLDLKPQSQAISYSLKFHPNQKNARIKHDFPGGRKTNRSLTAPMANDLGGEGGVTFFGLGVILAWCLFLIINSTGAFQSLFLERGRRQRRKLYLFFLSLTFAFFGYLFLSSGSVISKPEQRIYPSPYQGQFFPRESNMIRMRTPAAHYFSAIQGHRNGYQIEVDFRKSDQGLSLTQSEVILVLFSIIPIFFLYKSLSAGLLSLPILYGSIYLFYMGGILHYSTPVAFLPILSFVLALILKGRELFKKALFIICLFGLLQAPAKARDVTLFRLPFAKGEQYFMKQNDYHYLLKQSEKGIPNAPDLVCSHSISSLQRVKENLVLEHELHFKTRPGTDGRVQITLPFREGNVEVLNDTRARVSDFDLVELKETPGISTSRKLRISLGFQEKVDWRQRFHTPGCAQNTLKLGNTTGYEWDIQATKGSDGEYLLEPFKHYPIQLTRSVKKVEVKPEVHRPETREVEPDSIKVYANHNVELEENFAVIESRLKFEVKGTPLKKFFIHAPANLKVQSLNSSHSLEDWFLDEKKNILLVEFHKAFKGNFSLDLKSELKLKNKRGQLGVFALKNADLFENRFRFESDENLSFKVKPNESLLTSLVEKQDQNEARPVYLQEIRPGMKDRENQFQIQMIPRQVVHTVSAFIDHLNVVSYLHQDGSLYTRYQAQIRNNGQQFLKVNLPKECKILTARVNGERTFPGKEEKAVLFPMKMVFSSNREIEPFLLEFTTRSQVKLKGGIHLELARFSLKIASLKMSFSNFDQVHTSFLEGSLQPDVSNRKASFLGKEYWTNLGSLSEVPLDLPVFKNQRAMSFQASFLSPEEKAPYVKLKFQERLADPGFIPFLVFLILSFVYFGPYRRHLKISHLFILFFVLVLMKDLFPAAGTSALIGVCTAVCYLPLFLLFEYLPSEKEVGK